MSDDDRGAVLVIVALFLTIFVVVAALAVDLAALATRAQSLQNTADAAALAGVVEYQQQRLTAGVDEATAQSLALDKIRDLMHQNGIDLAPDVTFHPDGRVTVSIRDNDPESFLGGALFDPSVERFATAEFVSCLNECSIVVEIPKPFSSVSAVGNGDGYKPIPVPADVPEKLYAINHNSTDRNIVCVDRATQAPCWVDSAGNPVVARVAYHSDTGFDEENPEMPHAGVVGSRIYWSVSDESGHRLFCWETITDTPCPTAIPMGDDPRADSNTTPISRDKDENRGGGTVAYRDKIYVFTDNHEVHCYDPFAGGYCAGYTRAFGGLGTQLDGFPDHRPEDGNHGSSIDRIVDEATGRIYATIHVNKAIAPVDCAAPLADPAGERVVVLNAETGAYLATGNAGDEVVRSFDGTAQNTWWDVTDADTDSVYFRSADNGEYLDADDLLFPPDPPEPLSTSSGSGGEDDEWNLVVDGDAVLLLSDEFGGYATDDDLGGDIVQTPLDVAQSRWKILPWQCGDPTYTPPVVPAWYEAGTWVHCWDTGEVSGSPQPCSGFAPYRLHPDASRFSGRLWFHRASGSGAIQGICSSGYGTSFTPSDIHVVCVDMGGSFSSTMTGDMSWVQGAIRSSTGSNPGAWGDPHWNDFENRLFYPTEHDTSLIICWDFDDGPCGTTIGQTPPSPTGTVFTEDYGFISEDNCVFALGHNAYFWAFKASDIDEPCVGAKSTVDIERCPCNDVFQWGQLDFSDLDLTDFDVFDVQVTTVDPVNPVVVYPTGGGWHSLLTDGPVIDLDGAGVSTDDEKLTVVLYLEAENDPFDTELPTFTIRFSNRPHLTD